MKFERKSDIFLWIFAGLGLSLASYFFIEGLALNANHRLSEETTKKILAKKQEWEVSKLKKTLEQNTEQLNTLKNIPPPAPVITTIIKEKNQDNQPETISAAEMKKYISGLIEIRCQGSSGSGSLWKIGQDYHVITNSHVVEKLYPGRFCLTFISDESGKLLGVYQVYPTYAPFLDPYSDSAALELAPVESETATNLDITNLNYQISTLPFCSNGIDIGNPVMVVGYPASTKTQTYSEDLKSYINISSRTITNGVISGLDVSQKYPFGNFAFHNYYVSAKIDSGNSGGIAIAKDTIGKLCVLGIPTWLNPGNYDAQGIVQNINNIIKR